MACRRTFRKCGSAHVWRTRFSTGPRCSCSSRPSASPPNPQAANSPHSPSGQPWEPGQLSSLQRARDSLLVLEFPTLHTLNIHYRPSSLYQLILFLLDLQLLYQLPQSQVRLAVRRGHEIVDTSKHTTKTRTSCFASKLHIENGSADQTNAYSRALKAEASSSSRQTSSLCSPGPGRACEGGCRNCVRGLISRPVSCCSWFVFSVPFWTSVA